MQKKDLDFVYEICGKEEGFQVTPNYRAEWDKEKFKNWMNSKDDVLIVAEEENKIIGFALCSNHIPTGKSVIENVWVSEEHRNKGIGKELIQYSIKELKEKGSTYVCGFTKEDNLAPTKLLEKEGFDKGYSFYWMGKGV